MKNNYLVYGGLAHQDTVYDVQKVLLDSSIQELLQELIDNLPGAVNFAAKLDESIYWFQEDESALNPSVFTIRLIDEDATEEILEEGANLREIDFLDMTQPLPKEMIDEICQFCEEQRIMVGEEVVSLAKRPDSDQDEVDLFVRSILSDNYEAMMTGIQIPFPRDAVFGKEET